MSLAYLCRTCGKRVNPPNAISIFEKNNDEIRTNIQVLTGLLLIDDFNMPKNICTYCLIDLDQAIEFRERCLEIHKVLLKNWEKNDRTENDIDIDNDPLAAENKSSLSFLKDEEEVVESDSEALSEVVSGTSYQMYIPKSKQKSHERTTLKYAKSRQIISDQENDCKDTQTSTVKTYICERCERQFDDKLSLSLHRQEHIMDEMYGYKYEIDEYKHELDNYKDERDEYNDEDGSRKTDIDSEQFVPANQRAKRILINSAKPSNKKTWKSGNYFCDQCGRHFNDKANLNRHLQRHLGVKKFECEECGYKDYSQHLINLHIRIQHQGEKPYACKYCGERFANSMTRLRHERNHMEYLKSNSDLPVFACNLCKKTFKRKSILNVHSVVHTGEQPFRCETCNVKFNRKSSLRAHFRSKFHQNNDNRKLERTEVDLV